MRVVNAMDPNDARAVCNMGAKTVNDIAEALDDIGIDPKNTENVLLVALAGVMLGGDLTIADVMKGIESAQKLWSRSESGTELILGGALPAALQS